MLISYASTPSSCKSLSAGFTCSSFLCSHHSHHRGPLSSLARNRSELASDGPYLALHGSGPPLGCAIPRRWPSIGPLTGGSDVCNRGEGSSSTHVRVRWTWILPIKPCHPMPCGSMRCDAMRCDHRRLFYFSRRQALCCFLPDVQPADTGPS